MQKIKQLDVTIIFVGSCLLVLAVLSGIGWFYLDTQQTSGPQKLKSTVSELSASLASATYFAEQTGAGKTLNTYSQQFAVTLVGEAADSTNSINSASYNGEVTDKAKQASKIAHDYGETMSIMVQYDNPQDGARKILPTLRKLLNAADQLERSL